MHGLHSYDGDRANGNDLLGHVFAWWLLLFGKRRHLRNHVGVNIAAANFGLLIVPQHIITRQQQKNSLRANKSVDDAVDSCGDHFRKPQRRTARV